MTLIGSVETIKELDYLLKNPDDLVYVREEQSYYVCQDEEWIKHELSEADFKDGQEVKSNFTLYDMNKMLMAQAPALGDEALRTEATALSSWAGHYQDKFFMMLNHELRYFTLFQCKDKTKLGERVIDIITSSIGSIKNLDDNEHGAYEIWVEYDDGNCYLFLLFPYDAGVVEV